MPSTKQKSRTDRFEEHAQMVAAGLIKQIRQGTAPFQKPFRAGERVLPYNLKTGADYQATNFIWLQVLRQSRGFGDMRWCTYRQIQEIGGQVREGEVGTRVVGVFDARTKEERERDRDAGEEMDHVRRRFLVYTVFNADQCDGIPARETAEPAWDPCQLADKVIANSGVGVVHSPVPKAYYKVSTDQIFLPDPGLFESKLAYYHIALHELAHATGHESRMNRGTLIKYEEGIEIRAKEELYADIGAMLVCAKLGLGYTPQEYDTAAYTESWCQALGNDPHVIRDAAKVAGHISKYIIRDIGGIEDKDLVWNIGEKSDELSDVAEAPVLLGNSGIPRIERPIIQNRPARERCGMSR